MTKLALDADGTYKVHEGGWVLGVLGTHSAYYNRNKKSCSHSFRPFAYSFMRSESSYSYEVS